MKFTIFMIAFYSCLTVLTGLSVFFASSTLFSAACSVVITALFAGRIVLLFGDLKEERKTS